MLAPAPPARCRYTLHHKRHGNSGPRPYDGFINKQSEFCHRFRSNGVRLRLSVLVYNLGNLWRRLVLPRRIENWSLTSLQQRLVKAGGRLIKHARYYWLLAGSGLTGRLFGAMAQRIAAYRWRRGSRSGCVSKDRGRRQERRTAAHGNPRKDVVCRF